MTGNYYESCISVKCLETLSGTEDGGQHPERRVPLPSASNRKKRCNSDAVFSCIATVGVLIDPERCCNRNYQTVNEEVSFSQMCGFSPTTARRCCRRRKIQCMFLHLGKPPLPDDLHAFPYIPVRLGASMRSSCLFLSLRRGKVCALKCVSDSPFCSVVSGHRWTPRATPTKTEYQAASIFSKQLHLHAGKAGVRSRGGWGWGGFAISRVAQTPRRSPFINYLISDWN